MSFTNLFKKKDCADNTININTDNNTTNSFMESFTNIENDETRLLKLQNEYRSGEIKPEELTQEQVDALLALYDQQIFDLKISIELKKRKISEFKNKAKV